jgi:hypothetical protein
MLHVVVALVLRDSGRGLVVAAHVWGHSRGCHTLDGAPVSDVILLNPFVIPRLSQLRTLVQSGMGLGLI